MGHIFDSLDLFGDLPRAGGQKPLPVVEGDRFLEENPELVRRPKGEISTLQRLRHSHHLAARAIAEGKPPIAAAAISGYSISSINRLLTDPAFKELVAHYKEQVRDLFEQLQDRMGALGLSFLEELQDRLEASPESFSNKEALAIAEALLDRSVAPSKSAGRGNISTPGVSGGVNIQIAFVEPGGPKGAAHGSGPGHEVVLIGDCEELTYAPIPSEAPETD